MKNLLGALIIATICILLSACEKDMLTSTADFAEAEKTTLRGVDPGGCQPGSFTTERGRLRFNSERDYESMLNFLACASPQDLEFFQNSIPVETAQKAFMEFRELTKPGKINSAQELLDFETDYRGRISVHVDAATNDRSYSPSVEFFEEIAAPDGIFMVGEDYLKAVGKDLFRLKNGTEQDAIDIDKDTEPTPTGGLSPEGPTITVTEVVITTRGDDDPNCCPYSDKFERVYNSGKNKLQIEYKLLDFGSDQTGSLTALKTNLWLKASHDKRVSLGLFSYWGCSGTSLGMGYTVELEYQTTGDIFTLSQNFPAAGSNCTRTVTPVLTSNIIENVPPGQFNFREDICLNQVLVDAVNGANGITVSGDCGEATNPNDLNPLIKFYKHNNIIGNSICQIGLSPSVGHLNFKNLDVCDNDEARSAELFEIPAGTVLRIFDDSNGSTNDDFVVITALTNINYLAINTFESSFTTSQVVVSYCCGGNLDGKVSSMRDF